MATKREPESPGIGTAPDDRVRPDPNDAGPTRFLPPGPLRGRYATCAFRPVGPRSSLPLSRGSARAASVARGSRQAAACRLTRASTNSLARSAHSRTGALRCGPEARARSYGVKRCQPRGSQPSSASRRESDPDQAVGRVVDCRAARAVTGGRHLRSQCRRDRTAGRRRLQPGARAAARTRGIRKGPADRHQTLNPVASDHR
jgi:hypothetical protein